jgi:hypothetical protein
MTFSMARVFHLTLESLAMSGNTSAHIGWREENFAGRFRLRFIMPETP